MPTSRRGSPSAWEARARSGAARSFARADRSWSSSAASSRIGGRGRTDLGRAERTNRDKELYGLRPHMAVRITRERYEYRKRVLAIDG